MAISERTFADRLQRGRTMQAAIALFSPAFDPTDASLEAAAFLTFLDGLDTLNTSTAGLVTSYRTEAGAREGMVADIKERALRVLSYVKSNSAWKNHVPGIKSLADKIRGNTPRRPVVPAPGETPASPEAKRRSQGEQSFGDIAENLQRLVAAVQTITGYAPAGSDITVPSLQTLATSFAAKNSSMATLAQQAGLSQRDRLDDYNDANGLREKMKAIKQAVRAQYGSGSAEYGQVKGIAL